MSVERLVEPFAVLEDPRCAGKVEPQLTDILVFAVCAVIACAESWGDIQGSRMRPIYSYSQTAIRSDQLDIGWSNQGFASGGFFSAVLRIGSQTFMREPCGSASTVQRWAIVVSKADLKTHPLAFFRDRD